VQTRVASWNVMDCDLCPTGLKAAEKAYLLHARNITNVQSKTVEK